MNFDAATILHTRLFQIQRRGFVVVPMMEKFRIDLRLLRKCGSDQKKEESKAALHGEDTIAGVSSSGSPLWIHNAVLLEQRSVNMKTCLCVDRGSDRFTVFSSGVKAPLGKGAGGVLVEVV